MTDRPSRVLADGETLSLGKHTVRWFDTPHLLSWSVSLSVLARRQADRLTMGWTGCVPHR